MKDKMTDNQKRLIFAAMFLQRRIDSTKAVTPEFEIYLAAWVQVSLELGFTYYDLRERFMRAGF